MKGLNSTIKIVLGTSLITILFAGSYWLFASYRPKALSEIREVRGYKTQQETDVFDLPYPRYAKSLAADQTLNSKKFTFETDKSPQDIQTFYKNILLGDDWELKKEGNIDYFYTSEYKKDNLSVMVWSYYEADTKLTFASVEIMRFE